MLRIMPSEVIAILGVGAALLAVLVPLLLAMRGDMHRLETRLSGRIDAVSERLDTMYGEHGERLARIETRLDSIEDRLQQSTREQPA